MWFIMLPISLVLWALGPTIISTLLGAKFSPEASVKAGYTMAIIGSGLFFSALNRTCSMILHARNQTFLPSVTALIATIINTLGNALLLKPFGLYGLAAATTFSSCSQTVMLLLLLMYTCQVGLPLRRLFDFFSRTGLIMAALGLCWWASMQMVWYVIAAYSSQATCLWLLHSPAYWLFALPIALGCCFVYLITRRRLGVRIFLFE
jgi:peptidoglycan biosynthesis protein MviN/MurJ (putative lipid II flippase)